MIRLGIIGLSDGNGHPFSWAAIANGYDPHWMAQCGFPAIPQYLSRQVFPDDFLPGAHVSHVWTQSRETSVLIARASRIENVCSTPEEMIGQVDALLLARDDAENHYDLCAAFLKAGLPVFIDKPLAYTEKEARKILDAQTFSGQVFSTSAIRFAHEVFLSHEEASRIGKIVSIDAETPGTWGKYGMHLIDPILQIFGYGWSVKKSIIQKKASFIRLLLESDEFLLSFSTPGFSSIPIRFRYFGENGFLEKRMSDPFQAFRRSLERFLQVIQDPTCSISEMEMLRAVQILEMAL